MKKSDLLVWLSNQDWIQSVGECELINTSDGIKWYFVNALEVSNGAAIRHKYGLYVSNEGLSDENAYWQDGQPQKTMDVQSTPTYKMITFRTILNAVGVEMYTAMRMRLDAAAEQSLVLSDVLEMLKTYGPDGGIDINAASTKAIIQSMVATNVLTQDEADAVIALAD